MKFQIVPVAKPRMTQRDKWQKRPAVLRYRAFCDECRSLGVLVPESGAHIVFNMPMPASWSKKKKAEMIGRPHQQRPDVDNLGKAIFDAVLQDDSGVWDIRMTKVWAETGSIEIRGAGLLNSQKERRSLTMADEVDFACEMAELAKTHNISMLREAVTGEGQEYCEDCGEDLSQARREAAPWAIRCLPCASVYEKKQAHRR